MSQSRLKALRCDISRGGFSDERVFVLTGSVHHQGVASRRFMWTDGEVAIEEGEPPLGEKRSGLIAARIVEIHGQYALVSIPDGEVIRVPLADLSNRPAKAGTNVPIGS